MVWCCWLIVQADHDLFCPLCWLVGWKLASVANECGLVVAGLGFGRALAGGTICGAIVVAALAGGTMCGAAVGWFEAVAAVDCAGVVVVRGGFVLRRCCMSMPVELPIGGR